MKVSISATFTTLHLIYSIFWHKIHVTIGHKQMFQHKKVYYEIKILRSHASPPPIMQSARD